MNTTTVVVLCDGLEPIKQCPECFAPPFAVRTEFHSDGTHYQATHTIWCLRVHRRVVIEPMRPLDDEMKELLA